MHVGIRVIEALAYASPFLLLGFGVWIATLATKRRRIRSWVRADHWAASVYIGLQFTAAIAWFLPIVAAVIVLLAIMN